MIQSGKQTPYVGPIAHFPPDLSREFQLIRQGFTQLLSSTARLFIQADAPPTNVGPYVWVQINFGGDPTKFTVWYDDGA